jgi:hypothetical protein
MINLQLTNEEALILYSLIYDWYISSVSLKEVTSESVLNKVKNSLSKQLDKVELSATTKKELNNMQSKAISLKYLYGGSKYK